MRQSICRGVAEIGSVLDGIVVTQELLKVLLFLLRCLDYLRHKILKTLMIYKDGKMGTQEVVLSFEHGDGDCR